MLDRNLDILIQTMIRKFYTRKNNPRGNNYNDEHREIEEVFHLIGREVVPTCTEIGKLANLSESASYFNYRDQKFWQTLEDKVVELLSSEATQKMNLQQVS